CAVASACVYGNVGNGYVHASRICRSAAFRSGKLGSGQTAVKAIAVLPTASCIVLPQQRN
ncbi:MAG: hypothetical protein IKH26_12255, partial [Bacteroidaceae bacterium]|nr:hypothetical protein [Bacteroidaceae bacterium]